MPLNGGTYYPGTTQSVSHSFSEAQFTAEFDDALCDQAAWKNSRYEGSKLTAQKFNVYTAGDESYQNLATLKNLNTALFIADTVIGGTEDPQFATLRNHSYVNISKILLINRFDDSVQIIDKSTEPYSEFHRFVTSVFPTGNRCKVKVIDESISSNLKGEYKIKMNKGWLLKSFEFQFAGETATEKYGDCSQIDCLTENNSMYFYKTGSLETENVYSGFADDDPQRNPFKEDPTITPQNQRLRFRYGLIETHPGPNFGSGHLLRSHRIGPNFVSSSIIDNKFTRQFYTGSFGNIRHNPEITLTQADNTMGHTGSAVRYLNSTGLGSASKFLQKSCLNFLASNNSDTTLNEQEKTEMHITFLQGTKDFAPGFDDERSIGTFEIDYNYSTNTGVYGSGSASAVVCNGDVPLHHELIMKSEDDSRFYPTLRTYEDGWRSAHADPFTSASSNWFPGVGGCVSINAAVSASGVGDAADNPNMLNQPGITVDVVDKAQVYIQGGVLGEIGYEGSYSASVAAYGTSLINNMYLDNYYSGSLNYDISFLDKDHTLILDLDKDAELFDGIGDKGLLIYPAFTHPQISFNTEYYLQKAGIIDNTSDDTQNISENIDTDS